MPKTIIYIAFKNTTDGEKNSDLNSNLKQQLIYLKFTVIQKIIDCKIIVKKQSVVFCIFTLKIENSLSNVHLK